MKDKMDGGLSMKSSDGNKRLFVLLGISIALLAIVSVFFGAVPRNTAPGRILINEVMAGNKSAVLNDLGSYSDWIELYNPSNSPVNLEGWGLSHKKSKPVQWTFPAVTIAPQSYLVVYCDSRDKRDPNKPLHTNFNLSTKGAFIMLSDNVGDVVDSLNYTQMASNTSLGRDPGGVNNWKVFSQVTPGFENSAAGYAQYTSSLTSGSSPLQISEVMNQNTSTLKDDYGDYADWVEIHNTSPAAVNLSGYYLSDKVAKPLKWKFPDVTLQPDGYLVVFCSGKGVPKDPTDTQHLDANFGLSASEAVVLSAPDGHALDSVQLQKINADFSLARNSQGTFESCAQPTPGYPNDANGYAEMTAQQSLSGPVVISEVRPYDPAYANAASGKVYGWVEVKNISNAPVNLQGYGLTDNMKDPGKWRFPGITLQPGSEKLIVCNASNNSTSGANLQANFKLPTAGAIVGLFDSSDKLLDRINVPGELADLSYGRMSGNAGFFYFQTPTPGTQNAGGYRGVAGQPAVELTGGVYMGTQQVNITAGNSSDEVRYTTDGSTPTQSSALYSGPLSIKQTTALRVRAFKAGCLPSPVVTSTYFIGSTHSLPLISIVTDPGLLFDPTTGIYELGPNAKPVANQPANASPPHYQVANYLAKGQVSERPASFEVLDDSGKEVFDQNIAIRIQGGFSRDNPQKSFAIYARGQYGPDTMNYPFFSDLPFTQYHSLQLRDGGQADLYGKINEDVVLNLAKGQINCLTQDIKPYVVYINGQYWGVYYMEEKRNSHFVAQHTGIADNVGMNLLVGAGVSSDRTHLKNGTNAGYKALMSYVQTHDMSQAANFNYVAAQFDTNSFMDEMINEIYIANNDVYNMEFYQIPGGKWEQIFYDFCWTLGDPTSQTLAMRMGNTCGSTMFDALLQYVPWKEAFLKRFAWTMENIYPTQRVINAINQSSDEIASEMPAERAKFPQYTRNWDSCVESMRTFAKQRPVNMLMQLKSVFNLTGAQLRSYFDLPDGQLQGDFALMADQMQSIFGN